jgi:hypothetical protein
LAQVREVDAGLRITGVDVVRRQQSMPLRPHIIDLQQKILGNLTLDAEVVLRRVLRAQMRLEVAIH